MEQSIKHSTKGHLIIVNLVIILVILHLIFVIVLRQLLTSDISQITQNGVGSILLLGILLCLFLGFLITFVSLPIHRSYFLLLPLLVGTTAYLYPGSIAIKTVLFLTTVLCLALFTYLYRKSIDLHTSIGFAHIAFPKLAIIVNLYAFIIALLIFAVSQKQIDTFSFTLDPKLINEAINFTQPYINEQLEAQKRNLVGSTIEQLDTQLPFLASLPEEDKLQILNGKLPSSAQTILEEQGFTPEQITTFRQELERNLNATDITFDTESINDSIISSITQEVQRLINSLIQKNRTLIPVIISSSVFFSITFIGVLIKAIAIVLAIAITKFLIMLKLVQEKTTTITTKRLELVE